MKRLLRFVKRRFGRASMLMGNLVMVLCGALTVFIFASSFETVFNRDLPVVDAVSTVQLSTVERLIDGYSKVDQNDVGNYGEPRYLKIPSKEVKLVLAPVIKQGGDFLARANSGHFALTSAAKKGSIGNLFIYYRASWRTNGQPQQTQVGENFFVDTDRDWRYFFRVTAVKTLDIDDGLYVARDDPTSQLYLVAVDQQHHRLYVAQASLINVQNVRL